MIVMMDVWDESQYHKHVFIMSLFLLGLSSGESQSSRQMVINFHNSFHNGSSRRPGGISQHPLPLLLLTTSGRAALR